MAPKPLSKANERHTIGFMLHKIGDHRTTVH